MNLAAVVVFSLMFVSSLAVERQAWMARYPVLEDKNISAAVISTSYTETYLDCSFQCLGRNSCESFFFSNGSGECQLHDVLFMDADDAVDQEGLQYWYIVKDRDAWCPVDQGFQLLADDGPCVKFHTDKNTWYFANETCLAYSPDSHLLIMESQLESDLVMAAGKVMNNYFSAGIWIGLVEFAEDDYRWLDEREMNFTDWSNLDNSSPTTHDCVWRNRAYGWHWRPMPCTKNGHYCCEIEMNVTLYHSMMDVVI